MPFVQMIEFETGRIDEFTATVDEWLKESADWRTSTRAQLCENRDHPGTYVQMVEFPSYEVAMENSNRPETGKFAERLAALCDGAPTFHNLEVLRVDDM